MSAHFNCLLSLQCDKIGKWHPTRTFVKHSVWKHVWILISGVVERWCMHHLSLSFVKPPSHLLYPQCRKTDGDGWRGWVFSEGTCRRYGGRLKRGCRRKEVCSLWCDGRACVSPGELRKTYSERECREKKGGGREAEGWELIKPRDAGPLCQTSASPSFKHPDQSELWTYLYGGFACDVCNQEVHGNIFTVHVSVHPVLDVSWHLVCIQIVEVLEGEKMITWFHVYILHAHFIQ